MLYKMKMVPNLGSEPFSGECQRPQGVHGALSVVRLPNVYVLTKIITHLLDNLRKRRLGTTALNHSFSSQDYVIERNCSKM